MPQSLNMYIQIIPIDLTYRRRGGGEANHKDGEGIVVQIRDLGNVS